MANAERESRLRRAVKDNVFTNAFDYIFHKRHLTSRTRFKEIKRSKMSMTTMAGAGAGAGAEEEEAQEGVDALETVLMRMGEMGLYQWIMFVVMAPFAFMYAFVYFGQMFLTPTPQAHWCRVPALAGIAPALRRNLTAPLDPKTNAPDRCVMFVTDFKAVNESRTPPPAGTRTQPCQHGWEFQFEDIPYSTITSEREWVCGHSSYVYISASLFFVGAFLGGFVFGYMADTLGRIPALIGANMMAFFGGIATVYTKDFWDFCLARMMVGMAHDNCFMLIYILVLEYVGPRHRTFVANVSVAVFFGAGCVLLPWVALWIGDWRSFTWASTGPMAGVLLVPFIVPESARWLTSRGHLNRAIKVLNKVAWVNRRPVPRKLMDKFIAEFAETHEEESILTMLRSKLLRKMLALMLVCYMTVMLVFDCIVRLSENLGLDFFLTFSLSAFTEVPSTLLVAFLLDRGGRRILTCVPMFLTAVLTCIAIFVPKGLGQAALAIMARFTVSMSFSAVTQWATEVLPTSVRGSGSAGVHVSGYLAIMISPYIVFSEQVWHQLPFLFLTLLALVSGLVGLLLPETVGLPLPQTMADGEILVEEYSYYGKLTKKIQEGGEAIKRRFSTAPEKPIVLRTNIDDQPGSSTDGAKKPEQAARAQQQQKSNKKQEQAAAAQQQQQSNKKQEQAAAAQLQQQSNKKQEELQKDEGQPKTITNDEAKQEEQNQQDRGMKAQENQINKEREDQSNKEEEDQSKKDKDKNKGGNKEEEDQSKKDKDKDKGGPSQP